MKGKYVPLLAAAAIASIATAASAQAPTAEATGVPTGPVAGQYICAFKIAAVDRRNVRAEARGAVARQSGQLKHVYENSLRGFAARLPAGAVNKLRADPKIAFCEQDQYVHALVLGKPGGGGSTGQTVPWGISRVGAVGATYSGSAIAWVIDSGIDLDHPDLNVDTGRSRSFLGGTSTPDDQNGHGTHVAGTIAALDNSIGVVGVVPGAPVVAVRVLDRRGSGTISGVIAGVDYVAANGRSGDVANMSLGGGASSSLDTAVINAANKGIKFAIAAGNDGANANNYSPARVNGTNIYTVSAFANGDNWASFSNYANPPVDFAEPGVSVYSTYKGGGYATLSGTSMASPHLAGLLLLGSVRSGGTVSGDPDGNPDTIGVR